MKQRVEKRTQRYNQREKRIAEGKDPWRDWGKDTVNKDDADAVEKA